MTIGCLLKILRDKIIYYYQRCRIRISALTLTASRIALQYPIYLKYNSTIITETIPVRNS